MFADESDAHLVEQARQGVAAAFAVLVHRHAHAVYDPAAPNPRKKAVTTLVSAMQRLNDDRAHANFETWLSQLSADADASDMAAGGDGRTNDTTDAAGDVAASADSGAFTADDIDAIWSQLARRWPNGRRSIRVPHGAVWVATVVVTITVSAAVPWLLLTQFGEEPSIQELRSFPIYDERDQEPAGVDDLDDAEDPLPTFEFPTPPEETIEPDADTEPNAVDADAETNGADEAGTESADAEETDADEGASESQEPAGEQAETEDSASTNG